MTEFRRIAHLALALGLGTAAACAQAADAGPTAQVRLAVLQRATLNRDVTALGTVRVGTSRATSLSFPRTVEVTRVMVRVGSVVRRGQPLLEARGAPGGELGYAQATNAVRFARQDLDRVTRLAAQQLATRADVDAARRALADAQAQLAAADAQQLGNGTTTLRAPRDGVVTALQASPGLQLAAGSAALQIAPHQGGEIVVGVPPDLAASIHPGQSAVLDATFGAGAEVKARVASVAGLVDPQTRLVELTLDAAPLPPDWGPGTAVAARLATAAWSGWVVPRQAVLRDTSGQAYVFQDDHGRARRVDVTLRIDTPTRSGISGDLRPGLPLVVLGNYELDDGMALKVLP